LISDLIVKIKDALKGLFLYNLMSVFHAEKRELDEFATFCIFGRFIGFPFLFNYYHLRLMPYYMNRLYPWKRRVLKERDFFDYVYD
jgi:hypothetical protein